MHTKELKGLDSRPPVDAAGLRAELEWLLIQSSQDAAFAAESHYVNFQLGGLQAFIKIDMSSKPFLFWYCDLNERPVSPAVRKTIADFLWEKGGEKEKYLDLDATKLEEVRQDFRETGVKAYITNVNIPDIHMKAIQTIAERQGDLIPDEEKIIKLKNARRPAAVEKSGHWFNLFSRPAKSGAPEPTLESPKFKK